MGGGAAAITPVEDDLGHDGDRIILAEMAQHQAVGAGSGYRVVRGEKDRLGHKLSRECPVLGADLRPWGRVSVHC